jgi:hypothetical protein
MQSEAQIVIGSEADSSPEIPKSYKVQSLETLLEMTNITIAETQAKLVQLDPSSKEFGETTALLQGYVKDRAEKQKRLDKELKAETKAAESRERETSIVEEARASRWIYVMSHGRYYQRLTNGQLGDAITSSALNEHLTINGYDAKDVSAYKSGLMSVYASRNVYESPDEIVDIDGAKILNTYVPSKLKPVPGDWSPILQVLTNLVGGADDEDTARRLEFVLDWHATVLQAVWSGKPIKMGTALLFYGSIKGAGKGTLAIVERALLGEINVGEIGQRELDSQFNGWARGKLMFIANEVHSSSNRGKDTTNTLKTYITEVARPINIKNISQFWEDCLDVWIFFSNDTVRPVEIERGCRRWNVFQVAGKIPKELGARVSDDARAGGPIVQAFLAHLLARKSKVKPFECLDTPEKIRMMCATSSSAERFADEIKELGFQSVTGPWYERERERVARNLRTEGGKEADAAMIRSVLDEITPYFQHNGRAWIKKTVLMDIYAAWATNNGVGKCGSATVYAALRDVFDQLEEKPVKLNGRSERCVTGLDGMTDIAFVVIEGGKEQTETDGMVICDMPSPAEEGTYRSAM